MSIAACFEHFSPSCTDEKGPRSRALSPRRQRDRSGADDVGRCAIGSRDDRAVAFGEVTAASRECETAFGNRCLSRTRVAPGLPLCDAFSISKTKPDRERRMPQFQWADAAGYARDECPCFFSAGWKAARGFSLQASTSFATKSPSALGLGEHAEYNGLVVWAWVAELEYAQDLKSWDRQLSCGFDSRPRHDLEAPREQEIRSFRYRFFKSTRGVSETIARSKNWTRSASNLGIDSSPHPRQPQRWQRCGLMIVKVLRHDSNQCRV